MVVAPVPTVRPRPAHSPGHTPALIPPQAIDTYALMVHGSNPVISPKAMIAEFLGTGTLVFIGAGAGALGKTSLVGVALAHGLVLSCFAYAYGHLSGVHINPAVSLGFVTAGRYDALGLQGEEAVGSKVLSPHRPTRVPLDPPPCVRSPGVPRTPHRATAG